MWTGPGERHAAGVTRLAIDETAARRGQEYITLLSTSTRPGAVHRRRRRNRRGLAGDLTALRRPGGNRRSLHRHERGLIKGVSENLPNAAIAFDKFHAVKIVNDAVDRVPARR